MACLSRHVHEDCCMHVWHINDCETGLEKGQGSGSMSGPCMFPAIKRCLLICVCVCVYSHFSVMCVCARVAVSPIGLPGYGISSRWSCRADTQGIIMFAHLALRGFLAVLLLSYGWKWTHWENLWPGHPGPANRAYRSPRSPGQPWHAGFT